MKYLVLCISLLCCCSIFAQEKYDLVNLTDSTYTIVTGEEEAIGIDSATLVSQLLELVELKTNEYGRDLYRAYIADRERAAANRTLNQFTADTSYVLYAREKFLPRLTGEWLFRGDSTLMIEINSTGRVFAGPGGRIIPYSNSYLILRNSSYVDDVIFFRDFTSQRRKFIAILPDQSRLILTQRR